MVIEIRKFLMPHLWAKDEPQAHAPLEFDPKFGFENRPERKIKATFEEMGSLNLEPRVRDTCAHLHIEYRSCMMENVPIWWRCRGYLNEVKHCYYEERIHDMKEFERERRLKVRESKLRASS